MALWFWRSHGERPQATHQPPRFHDPSALQFPLFRQPCRIMDEPCSSAEHDATNTMVDSRRINFANISSCHVRNLNKTPQKENDSRAEKKILLHIIW